MVQCAFIQKSDIIKGQKVVKMMCVKQQQTGVGRQLAEVRINHLSPLAERTSQPVMLSTTSVAV